MTGSIALSNRLHLFAHPAKRDAMRTFFTDVLGCSYAEVDAGMEQPVGLVRTARGAFSIEYRTDAYDENAPWRGAWIEFVVPDRDAMQQRLREAGVPEFRHPGSSHTYFRAPNGQPLRIIGEAQLNPR